MRSVEKSRIARKIIVRALVYFSTAVLAFAVVVVHKTVTNPSRSVHGVSFFESDRYQYQANPETAFEPRPGFTGISDLSEPKTYFTYDMLGARVDNPGVETTIPVYLMTIGCSQSWGQGVNNNQTFTAVLAKRLKKPVANFSVSAYGGVGSLLRLRQHINLKPKVIVYAFWEDHFNRNVDRCSKTGSPVCLEMPTVQFDVENYPYLQFPSNAIRNLESTRMWFLEASGQTDKYRTYLTDFYWSAYSVWRSIEKEYRQITGHPEEPSDEKKIAAANFVLDQMKLTVDLVEARLVVVYIPLYFDNTMRRAPQDMKISAERKGITFIDMTNRLQAMRMTGVPLAIPGDGHMTTAVHLAVADEVMNELQRNEVGERHPR